MADQNLMQDVTELANEAVEAARGSGIELDYSGQSIEQLEGLLDVLWKLGRPGVVGRIFGRKGRSEEETEQLASVLGAYVGEVFRKELGGEWYLDKTFDPEGTVALKIGEHTIFPPAKVYKRLVNGPEDNVWFYYRVMVERIREDNPDGQSG